MLDNFTRVAGKLLTEGGSEGGEPVEMIAIPRGLLEDLQYILNDYQDRLESDHLLGGDDFLNEAPDHEVAAVATAEVVYQLIDKYLKGSFMWLAIAPEGGECE